MLLLEYPNTQYTPIRFVRLKLSWRFINPVLEYGVVSVMI